MQENQCLTKEHTDQVQEKTNTPITASASRSTRPSHVKSDEIERSILQSIEEVVKFYSLDNRPYKSKNSKHGFECFSEITYDHHSLSNAFKTTGGIRLAEWIKGLQDNIFIDLGENEEFDIEWKNKTDSKNKYTEIEIKILDAGTTQVNLAIHVFLSTCLIQVKGKMFTKFQDEVFPKIYAKINANNTEPINTETGNGTSDHISKEEAIDKVTDNNGNNKMNENVKLEDLNKELDFLTSDNKKLKESISLLDKSLADVIKAVGSIKEAICDSEAKLSKQISNLERKYEDKLQIYNNELKEEMKKDITNIKQSFRDRFAGLEDSLRKRITNLEEKFDNLPTTTPQDMILEDTQIQQISTNETAIQSLQSKVYQLENILTKFDEKINTEHTYQQKATSYSGAVKFRTPTPQPEAQSYNHQPDHQENEMGPKSLVVLMDSNRRFINTDKLWRDCEMVPCYHIKEAKELINKISTSQDSPKAILIHTGVNDIEDTSPQELFKQIKDLVHEFQSILPNTKLILSELTPRMDSFDRDVLKVNEMIKTNIPVNDKITIIRHNSLRAFQHFRDNKHVTNTSGIARLAGNLKHGIRIAFGIQTSKRDGSIPSPRLAEPQLPQPQLPPQWQNNYQHHSKPKDADQKLDTMCNQMETLISLLKFQVSTPRV